MIIHGNIYKFYRYVYEIEIYIDTSIDWYALEISFWTYRKICLPLLFAFTIKLLVRFHWGMTYNLS